MLGYRLDNFVNSITAIAVSHISASNSCTLDKQVEKIKHLMEDINAFNVGKKREEAIEALAVWLPQVEKFLAQTKSSQDYIDQLTD